MATPVAVPLTARISDMDCFGGLERFGGSRLKKNFPSLLSGSSESERPSIFTAVKPSTRAWCTLVYSANRPPSRPSMTCSSHGGRVKSS